MKYLIVLAVVAVVYALWRSQRRGPDHQGGASPRPRIAPPQDMVRCARCGMHLPKDEALWKAGRSYCCQAHQDQGP